MVVLDIPRIVLVEGYVTRRVLLPKTKGFHARDRAQNTRITTELPVQRLNMSLKKRRALMYSTYSSISVVNFVGKCGEERRSEAIT